MFDFLSNSVQGLFIFSMGTGLLMLLIDFFLSRFHPRNAVVSFLLGVIAALLFVICAILYESSPLEKNIDQAIKNSKILEKNK